MRLETLPYKSPGSSVDASIPARAALNDHDADRHFFLEHPFKHAKGFLVCYA